MGQIEARCQKMSQIVSQCGGQLEEWGSGQRLPRSYEELKRGRIDWGWFEEG